jgi:hypothetical protein
MNFHGIKARAEIISTVLVKEQYHEIFDPQFFFIIQPF